MSQVIMILLFPIGLFFYIFKELPYMEKYHATFDDYAHKLHQDTALTPAEKLSRYRDMLRHNDYTIVEKTSDSLVAEKQVFSMSLFAMGVGVYMIGGAVYYLYYRYVQRPHRVSFSV